MTVTGRQVACVAALAGEAPAGLTGLLLVRCLPTAPGQGDVAREGTHCVHTALAQRICGKSACWAFSSLYIKTV